jgi:hypothetical protein
MSGPKRISQQQAAARFAELPREMQQALRALGRAKATETRRANKSPYRRDADEHQARAAAFAEAATIVRSAYQHRTTKGGDQP